MGRNRSRAPNLDWFVLVTGLGPPLAVALLFWQVAAQIADVGLRNAVMVRDAIILWTGGLLARAGDLAAVFDPHGYQVAAETVFGAGFAAPPWAYPPPMLLLAVPVSFLPVACGFVLWSAAGMALLWLGARAAGLGRTARLLAVLSPAAIENVLSGQNGLLTASLLLPGLVLLSERPWLAGALLGGLILKPQLAVLVPICLLASRNGRAAAAAALTATALAGVSTVAFGWTSWADFLFKTMPFIRRVIVEADWYIGPLQSMIATPFMAARWAGAPVAAAYAVQAAFAVAASALCWQAWRRPGADPLARAALTLALAFLVSPYGMSYDMPALDAALIGLAARDGAWRGEARLLFAVAWIWPGCGFLLGTMRAPPLGLAAVACAVLLARQAARRRSPRRDLITSLAAG